MYRIVQNIPGPKLLWLGHHVSIRGRALTFPSKQCPAVLKHFKIKGKTFAVQAKPQMSQKFWCSNILYHTVANYAEEN